MSVKNRNSIVTDGLVFYVDAGNSRSYDGVSGGTTWTDLVGSSDGALTNMETNPSNPGYDYDTDNGGYINFDGTDDYVSFSNLNPTANSSFTYSLWVRPTSNSSDGALIGNWSVSFMTYYDVGGANANYRTLVRKSDNSSVSTSVNTDNATLNQWSYVTTSFDSTNLKLYVDGSLVETVASGLGPLTASVGSGIGAEDSAGGRHFSGNIAACDLYDRILSASEVLQNYNALKNRFI